MPDVRLPRPPRPPPPPPKPPRGSDEWNGPGCLAMILAVLALIAVIVQI